MGGRHGQGYAQLVASARRTDQRHGACARGHRSGAIESRRHLGDRRRSARQAADDGRTRAEDRHRRAGQRGRHHARQRPRPSRLPRRLIAHRGAQRAAHHRQVRLRSQHQDRRACAHHHPGRVPPGRRQDQQDQPHHRQHAVGHHRHPRRHHDLQRRAGSHDGELHLRQQHDRHQPGPVAERDAAGLAGDLQQRHTAQPAQPAATGRPHRPRWSARRRRRELGHRRQLRIGRDGIGRQRRKRRLEGAELRPFGQQLRQQQFRTAGKPAGTRGWRWPAQHQ